MALTDTAIRNTKPRSKPLKISDGGGLFLLITPKGGKWWRLQYRVSGKQKLISLGVYPDIGLKEARERRDEARKQLAVGIDPSENRKATKAARAEKDANTFEVVAREWVQIKSSEWDLRYHGRIITRFEKDLFPKLGKRPISEITAQELLIALRLVEERGVRETAHRMLEKAGHVLRYAIITGRAKHDITVDLRGALLPVKKKHLAAIIKPKEVGGLLRACRDYKGNFVTKCALQLAPLVFLRPGELRQAEWAEFNLDKSEWNVPANRMKIKNQGDHLVPLAKQSIKILKELQEWTGNGRFVFPSLRTASRPMSDNAILGALRRLGYSKEEMTGHGFRAMARTILDEVLHVRVDYIEHQMAHAVRDPNGRAYNRTAHVKERRKMMQDWADYLDKLAATIDEEEEDMAA